MAYGANLVIASAFGGLAASALWSESTFVSAGWFETARGVLAALSILAGGLWAYLAALLFVTQLNLGARIAGRKVVVRLLEGLILVVTVPVTVLPFAMVADARMVAACDQWWAGHRASVPNWDRCAVLSRDRGVTRRAPETSPP